MEPVIIQCEGCAETYTGSLTPTGKVSSRNMPGDWSSTGRSRKHPGRIAAWCPTCMNGVVWQQWKNPTREEVNELAGKRAE